MQFLPLAQTERGEAHIITSDQGKASSYSTSLQEDNCAVVPFLSPPMPLPFDDPRFSQPQCQHDKQGEKYDDTSSYCQEVPVPLRSAVDTDPETTHTQENRNESLVKDSSVEATSEVTEIHYSSEEEDDCPICLEGELNEAIYFCFIFVSSASPSACQFLSMKELKYNNFLDSRNDVKIM